MAFNDRRREPFLDEASFDWNVKFTMDEVLPDLRRDASNANLSPLDQTESLWRISSELLDHAIRLYSAGQPVLELSPHVRASIESADKFVASVEDGSLWPQLDLATQTHYVHALWLLSLVKLLGLGDEQVEHVANFYAADETNDGADELFELILAKLGRKSFDAEGLIHEDPYQYLLDCVKAEPEARPALMTQFLKRWFKGQKECDWWGSHINRKGGPILKTGFFGYWAFEAALVTYLWDIDDSSYRDLPHYPKDLIDFARANAQRDANGKGPSRVPGGQLCPRTGYWFTPARQNSRAHFEAGQTMPDVGGTWGATIWQWDEQQ